MKLSLFKNQVDKMRNEYDAILAQIKRAKQPRKKSDLCQIEGRLIEARRMPKWMFDELVTSYIALYEDRKEAMQRISRRFVSIPSVKSNNCSAVEFYFVESFVKSLIAQGSTASLLDMAELYRGRDERLVQSYLEQAIAVDVADARQRLARFFLEKGDCANAKSCLKDVEDSYRVFADFYYRNHEYEKAEFYLLKGQLGNRRDAMNLLNTICRLSLQQKAKDESNASIATEERLIELCKKIGDQQLTLSDKGIDYLVASVYQKAQSDIAYENVDKWVNPDARERERRCALTKAIEYYEKSFSDGVKDAGRALGEIFVCTEPLKAAAYYEKLPSDFYVNAIELAKSFANQHDCHNAAKWLVRDLRTRKLDDWDMGEGCRNVIDAAFRNMHIYNQSTEGLQLLLENGKLNELSSSLAAILEAENSDAASWCLDECNDDMPF